MQIAMNNHATCALPHGIAHESMAVQPLTLERDEDRSSFYLARVCHHFTEPIPLSTAQEPSPGRQQNFSSSPPHSQPLCAADPDQLFPRNFSIIEMNFLRSEDLIVLVPFTRDQNQIAPLSGPQPDADGRAPILLHPVTPFGLRAIIPKPLQTGLLYSILDFGQNPERVFGTRIVRSSKQD